jgi:hypothetical protein
MPTYYKVGETWKWHTKEKKLHTKDHMLCGSFYMKNLE